MAARFPDSRFLGIDASQRQIADGRTAVTQLGLQNLELRHQDILDFPADAGEFDDFISHGVYSWIPGPVQTRMLDICSRHLAPRGIAYICYNTYPGWHMRAMIRYIMRYREELTQFVAQRVAKGHLIPTRTGDSSSRPASRRWRAPGRRRPPKNAGTFP